MYNELNLLLLKGNKLKLEIMHMESVVIVQ